MSAASSLLSQWLCAETSTVDAVATVVICFIVSKCLLKLMVYGRPGIVGVNVTSAVVPEQEHEPDPVQTLLLHMVVMIVRGRRQKHLHVH